MDSNTIIETDAYICFPFLLPGAFCTILIHFATQLSLLPCDHLCNKIEFQVDGELKNVENFKEGAEQV